MMRAFFRPFSTLLVIAYTATNVLFAHAAESNIWDERRRAAREAVRGSSATLVAQLPAAAPLSMAGPERNLSASLESLPPQVRSAAEPIRRALSAAGPFAALREYSPPSKSDGPVAFLIQDLHGAPEAQKNVASLLERWTADGPVRVGLEGAEGPFDFSPHRELAGPVVRRWLADYFLEKDDIGGAEAAALSADAPPELWGVETPKLYQAHVRALREGLASRPEAQARLAALAARLAALKEIHYSPALKEFDKAFQSYHADGSLGDYVKFLLWHGLPGREIDIPNLHRFLKALETEHSLDFKQVEAERSRLIEDLSSRLSPSDLQELVAASLALRSGGMTHAAFYTLLRGLARGAGADLGSWPVFNAYVDYVTTAESIDRTALLQELTRRERAVADALARTTVEKALVVHSRDYALLDKLVRNAMTPEEWEAYRDRRNDIHRLPERLDVPSPSPLDSILSPYEDFCRLALARDQALAENALGHWGRG